MQIISLKNLVIAAVLFFAAYCLPPTAYGQSGVKGKVRDPRGGGVAGATVEARQEGKVIRSTKTDSKGNFTLLLPVGKYNLGFEADGYSLGVFYRVEVKGDKTRDLGGNLILSRDKGSLVLVKGIVFDKDQLSVAGAQVDLYVIKSDGSEKKVATAYTNISGDFSFRGIDPVNKVRVRASFRGATESKDIDIDQPQVYRTSIILPYERPKPPQ